MDDFREVSQLMLKTHLFSQAAPRQGDSGGRVEYLPVHWHAALHKDECGVDKCVCVCVCVRACACVLFVPFFTISTLL